MKSGAKKVIIAALGANLLIAATKMVAAWITGSSAILSEAIHSIVDGGNQVLLLHGQRRAALAPDEEFPFGHGKEIYFWSFVVSILVFSVGAGLSLFEGINHLIHPQPMRHVKVNYLIIAASLLFEGFSWVISVRELGKSKAPGQGYYRAIREGKDPSLFLVVLEDTAALLGLAAALAGIYLASLTGSPLYDGAASVVIGLILGGTAILIAHETKGLLVGEAASREVVQLIKEIVQHGEHVEHVNEVLTLHMGPEYIVVNISLDFNDEVSAGEIERTVPLLEREIKLRVPEVKKVFVEAEAWRRPKVRSVLLEGTAAGPPEQ
ncbi:cation diffusion facilitator family transporter [Geomonas sp. Red32]|uniref:cation diffusion facilitator family transporter n=1 Tax=Geomonas sp. Red32 TaxID=2912856 RepID=UPI00202CC24F|nr:cation diffusion facilitator family transporter [Geomonas sp. Red32]MCM0080757.1 cation diffusion facilitator family transporter [Geomonas sp. Red32]